MRGHDSSKGIPSAMDEPRAAWLDAATHKPPFHSDLAGLAAKLAASRGGGLSPEQSSQLALEIVLNQIAEQACLATGANGAAVILKQDTEMICRASTGEIAPDLGSRMDTVTGLSGLCLRTRTIQRCDDALTDPRADNEACRDLGIRSVIILPLLHLSEVVGLFEIFSARLAAFGDRDEQTLMALSLNILRNLEKASDPFLLESESDRADSDGDSRGKPDHDSKADNTDEEDAVSRAVEMLDSHVSARRAGKGEQGTKIVTSAMAIVVLACSVGMVLLTGQRLGWNKLVQPILPDRSPTLTKRAENTAGRNAARPSLPVAAAPSTAAAPPSNYKTSSSAAAQAGGLIVYQNGKEVFRAPLSDLQGDAGLNGAGVEPASAIESDQVLQLPAESAEQNIVYRVEPEYPATARQQQVQGAVILQVRVRRDGSVKEAKVTSGNPLLAEAARVAVSQWRFKPQTMNARAVEMQTQITLNFLLPQ